MSTKYIDTTFQKSFDPKTVDETRKIKFIISTGGRDRGGEVINMKGWQLDKFNANPIVGYQHAIYGGTLFSDPDPDNVIAKGPAFLDTFQGKDVLVSEAEFEPADINPRADKIFKKVKFGTLNTASVGILPIGSGTYKKEEKTYYYDGQELLEWSVVNIPMNGEAQRMSMKSFMQTQANELLKRISVDDKLKQIILDAIEKQYGQEKAEEIEENGVRQDSDWERISEVYKKVKSQK